MVLIAAQLGNRDMLGDLCRMSLKQDLHALEEQAELSTEADALAYAARLSRRTMTCLALLTRDGLSEPTTAQQVLDIAIARKAFVADAERVFWRKWRAIDDQAFAAAGAALVTRLARLTGLPYQSPARLTA